MTQPQQQNIKYIKQVRASRHTPRTRTLAMAARARARAQQLSRTSFSLQYTAARTLTLRQTRTHTHTQAQRARVRERLRYFSANMLALSLALARTLCSFGMRAMLIPIRRQSRPAHLHAHSCTAHPHRRRDGNWSVRLLKMLLVRPVHDQALCQVLTNTHTRAYTAQRNTHTGAAVAAAAAAAHVRR